MTAYAGWQCDIDVNDNPYGAKSWMVESETPPLRVDNTEGRAGHSLSVSTKGYAAIIPGIAAARVRISSATYDDTDNIFETPHSIRDGDWITLNIYPAGRTGTVLAFAGFVVTKVTLEGEVEGLQPITFEGHSDGEYTLAGLLRPDWA